MTEETESQAPTAPVEEQDRDDPFERVVKELLAGRSQLLASSVFEQQSFYRELTDFDPYHAIVGGTEVSRLFEHAQAAVEAQKTLELEQLKRQVGVLQKRVSILEEAAQAPLEAPPSRRSAFAEAFFEELLRRLGKGTAVRILPEDSGHEERSQEFESFESRLTDLASVEDGWLAHDGNATGLAPNLEALDCLRTTTLRGSYPIPSVFSEIDGTVTAQWRSGRRVARIEFRPDGVLTGRTIPKTDYALRTSWKTSPRLSHQIASFLNEVDIP